jgi:hypothetical protein
MKACDEYVAFAEKAHGHSEVLSHGRTLYKSRAGDRYYEVL